MLLALYEALFVGINLLMDEETEAQRGKGPCLNPTPAVSSVFDGFANFGKNKPCIVTPSAHGIIRYGILRDVKKWERFQEKKKKLCSLSFQGGKNTWNKIKCLPFNFSTFFFFNGMLYV